MGDGGWAWKTSLDHAVRSVAGRVVLVDPGRSRRNVELSRGRRRRRLLTGTRPVQWSMSDNWINPRLGAWLSSLLGEAITPSQGDISVTFGPPGPDGGPASQAGRAKQGINLHLLSIAPHEQATARV